MRPSVNNRRLDSEHGSATVEIHHCTVNHDHVDSTDTLVNGVLPDLTDERLLAIIAACNEDVVGRFHTTDHQYNSIDSVSEIHGTL